MFTKLNFKDGDEEPLVMVRADPPGADESEIEELEVEDALVDRRATLKAKAAQLLKAISSSGDKTTFTWSGEGPNIKPGAGIIEQMEVATPSSVKPPEIHTRDFEI